MNLDRANAMVELKQLKSLINDLELIKTNFTNPYYKHNTDESMRKEYFYIKDDMRKLLKRCRRLLFEHKKQVGLIKENK